MNQKLKKILIQAFVFIAITLLLGNGIVFAKSSSDIQKDIDAQQKALEQEKVDLEKAKNNLNYFNSALSQSAQGLPQIEAQIAQVKAQLEYNQKQLDVLNQNKEIKELEKAKREAERQESLKGSYMEWKSKSNQFAKVLTTQSQYDLKKNEQYSDLILKNQQKNILGLTSELEVIAGDLDQYNTEKTGLESSNNDLNKKKLDLESAISYFSSAINNTSSSINKLQSGIANTSNAISVLSNQQKEAYLAEAALAAQSKTGQSVSGCRIGDDGNNDNNIEFCGLGNDFQQGNEVGMSQYGAYGMAQKGYTSDQILKLYYTGVSVSQYNLNSQITVKYCSDYPSLDAYQTGCNPGSQLITERVSFDQYLSGIREMSSSWPLEARKAQIIAARTYAVNYTNNGDPNIPICLTTYCQVSFFKTGDQSESDAVAATKDLIITYNGTPIEALYGSDNNQGFGSANVETMFQDFSGNGNAIPYLRAANDTALAAHGPWTDWGYKSKTYSMDDIFNMINWTISYDKGGFGSFLQGVKNQLGGKPTKISAQRDPSMRAQKVTLQSPNGSAVIGGWWFTYMYNIYNIKNNVKAPNGSTDELWSQTFFIHVK